MKKSFLLLICTLLLANFLYAQPNLSGKKIYVNPGHGSYGFNDRPQSTILYPFRYSYTDDKGRTSRIPDTTGFFETNTNLWKCLYLGEKLQKYGATVSYSHTKAGPDPYPYIDGTAFDWNGYKADPEYYTYNRPLFSDEVPGTNPLSKDIGNNFSDYDYFISVHSNAQLTTDDPMANYPMFLYRGYNGGESNPKNVATATRCPYNKNSHEMAVAAWRHAYELIEGISSLRHPTIGATPAVDNMLIYGDRDYYTWDEDVIADTIVNTFGGKKYPAYLGAICHMVPGFVVEGYHHTYGPARHRALNKDYCKMEGLAYFRGILDYFDLEGESVGYILGVIKDNNKLAPDHKDYRYHPGSHDQWMPCNGAVVTLKNGGQEVGTYTVDQNYNGIFAFFDLEPGTYTLESTFGDLEFSEQVVVRANETTYSRLYPKTTPAICAYNLQVEEGINSYTFSFDANSAATTAKIVFYNNEKEKIGSYPISAVKGTNSITLSTLALPGDAGQTLSWAVELTGKEITEFALIHSDKSLDMYPTSQLFNAVNTNPMSENFGEIYVMHRANTNTNNAAQAAESGLYVYDFDLERQNYAAYQGGVTFGHPTRMSIDSEGYLYISDWSDAQSGIYVANTADLTQNFTQFFAGNRANNGKFINGSAETGSSTPGCYIYETQNSTKLYVYDEDVASNGVLVYNIKEGNDETIRQWTIDPSQFFKNFTGHDASGNANVWVTSKGFFVSQHTNTSSLNRAEVPSLQFYNNNGELVFTSAEGDWLSIINACDGAGYAVSKDEETLILNNGSKQFLVFNITWNGETPTLALRTTYEHGLGAIRQMNWDYAGNLVCSGDEGIHIFTVPTNDNTTLVPARAPITKEQPQLSPATQRIWAFDLKHKATMAGYQFTFKSVANGVGSLLLKDEQGEALKSFYIPSVTQGENTFTIPYDDMPQTRDDLSWEITLAAGAVEQGANLKEITTDMAKFHYYFPQGVAINNNPNSEHFGKIYIANTQAGTTEYNYNNDQTVGIYVLDALLNAENYNTSGYIPQGVDVTPTPNYTHRTLHRIAVNPQTDDVAFVQSKTNHLWIANPNDLNAPATNIIQGLGTYASSLCYDSNGNLFVFGYNSAEEKAIIYKKEAGSDDFNSFVEIDPWEYENERNSMASDGRGGLWVVSKFAGNENHFANFFHINPNTTVDFNITTDGTTLSAKTIKGEIPANMPKNFNRGHVAYDAKHNILALGGESKVALFRVTYGANNIPTLVYWISTPTLGANIDGIAFDYAGDLVVLSASTERFYKFAVPTDNNVCTTPAPQIIPYRFVLQDTKHNQTALNNIMDQPVNTLVCRSLTAGMYNTLCLPFALDAFDDTPLEGAEVLKYSHSDELDGDILLYFDAVTNMEAGVPYLIEPQVDIQGPIDFNNVTISVSEGRSAGSGITFNGILSPKELTVGDKSILFLVSDNKLAWANATANMNGMRAYFSLPNGAYDQLRTSARIVTSEAGTTDIHQTTTQANTQKIMQNGRLYIRKDGQIYTILGRKVK